MGRSQIVDKEISTQPMTMGQYRELVNIGIDEADVTLENAIIDGDALGALDAKEELKTWRGRGKFADLVEENPDTPVRWNGQ